MDGFPKFITSTFKNVILKLIILHHAKKGMYPYAFMKVLKSHGSPMLRDLTKNDVYNAISSLENAGLIAYNARKDGKSVRKYYRLTNAGEKALRDSKAIRLNAFKSMARLTRGELNG